MNRGKFYFVLIFAALLVAAGVLGFYLGKRNGTETGKAEVLPVRAMVERTSAPAEKRETSIQASSAAPTAAELKSAQRLARLQAITDLNRLLGQKISVPMLLGESLNKDFVALFDLSSGEVKSLSDAIAKVKAQLAELESRHAQIEPKGPGKFTITIPIFPKEGGLVLDEFLSTVRSTIGDDRYGYYNDISRFSAESNSAFGMFGLSQTVINVQEMRGANGKPSANSSSDSDPESGGMVMTVNTAIELLPWQYPHLYRKLVDSGAIAPASGQ